MRTALLALFLAFSLEAALAQEIDLLPATGVVGQQLSLSLIATPTGLDSGEARHLQAELKLSNPTIYLPQAILGYANVTVDSVELRAVSDTIYRLSCQLHATGDLLPGDTLVQIRGEVLAGNDTLLVVELREIQIDGRDHPADTAVVRVASIGTPLPYVRFARLDRPYPNPAEIGQQVTWGYRIDRRSDVTFGIFDMVGQLIHLEKLGVLDPGVYVYRFTPDFTFPSGVFWARLNSNSGEASQPFMVLR